MKTKTYVISVAVLLAALLVAGCHGGENSITGTMGPRVLTGQVQMVGDRAGTSPSGVSVTAPGQVATTDASGNFAFASVADGNVPLAFSRNDGISASGTVNAAAASVVVELSTQQATIKTTGQLKKEIEGLVTKIASDSITVNDASTHGPVTAAINSTTVIRHGNTTMTTDKINVGDRVHVKANVNSDGTFTAFEIMVQNQVTNGGGGGGQTKELEGPITKISSTSISVMNASTKKEETAAITSTTIIRKGNTRLTTDNLKVGDRVHVKTTSASDGSLTATEIMLQNPA